MLKLLNPSQDHYTGVCVSNKDNKYLVGQVTYRFSARSARLSFLTPADMLDTPATDCLLDHLAVQAGGWGAFHLLAEAEEHTPAFDALRQSGFATYAWQRIWRFSDTQTEISGSTNWCLANESDNIAIRSLYLSIVPGLLQPVEPCPEKDLEGLVYRQGGDLFAFCQLIYGLHGIWVQPFIHPAYENAFDLVIDLLKSIPNRFGRPIYLCVRSYQAWLEPVLEDLSAEASPRQAVMVKHLGVLQKVIHPATVTSRDAVHPEASVPIANLNSKFLN